MPVVRWAVIIFCATPWLLATDVYLQSKPSVNFIYLWATILTNSLYHTASRNVPTLFQNKLFQATHTFFLNGILDVPLQILWFLCSSNIMYHAHEYSTYSISNNIKEQNIPSGFGCCKRLGGSTFGNSKFRSLRLINLQAMLNSSMFIFPSASVSASDLNNMSKV